VTDNKLNEFNAQTGSGVARKPWTAPEIQAASIASTAAKSPDFVESTFAKNGS
jgi:hypothetical protein